jgi:hypothetical protein
MVELDFSGLSAKPRMAARGSQRSWLAVAVSLSVFALLAAMVMVAGNNRQSTELEVNHLPWCPECWANLQHSWLHGTICVLFQLLSCCGHTHLTPALLPCRFFRAKRCRSSNQPWRLKDRISRSTARQKPKPRNRS